MRAAIRAPKASAAATSLRARAAAASASAYAAPRRTYGGEPEEKNVYASVPFYLERHVLSVSVRRASMRERGNYLTLTRVGGFNLEVAPLTSNGPQWKAKHLLSLQAHSMAEILNLNGRKAVIRRGPPPPRENEADEDVPAWRAPDEGHEVVFSEGDDGALEFTLKMTNDSHEVTFEAKDKLSAGQYEMMKCLVSHTIPHLCAWGSVVEPVVLPSDNGAASWN